MLNLQKEFENFHNRIKLDDENHVLREKRDILLNKLKVNICEDAASYTTFNQGSYAMGTGIIPENDDYDIDVGIKFNINKDDYTDPIIPKKWVRDALDGHTKSVTIRRSCVTVTYQQNGEAAYHVDFAIYSDNNDDNKMYISKGKEHSLPENRKWEISDPQCLIDTIKGKFSGDDARQFRRVIRYLKKWKTHNFKSEGNSAPTGISLTALAFYHYNVNKTYDWSTNKYVYNDFAALYDLIQSIKEEFKYCYDSKDGSYNHIITTQLPVEPYNNLFDKMTNVQMNVFYNRICSTLEKLKEVQEKNSRTEACEKLVEIFGEDFPVTVDKSFVGTSESA